jgi:hypothetical protein
MPARSPSGDGELRSAFSVYTSLLRRRLDYMKNTSRLSDRSREELRRLDVEISALDELLKNLRDPVVVSPSRRTELLRAHRAELDRYGELVIADSRRLREQSGSLRDMASRTRASSRRAAGASKLRILRRPEPISIRMLDRMLGATA